MKDYIIDKYRHMLHGADYNPDQWQDYPEILSEDMRLMKIANCNEMTLGIFSWSTLEAEEGVFNFSFLDKAIDDVYAAGGRVILATPSGARPVWLAEKYPDVLPVDSNGVKKHFGGRHNHCCNSSAYREKVKIINTKLAERYGKHPALIAWHISNEYNGTECHCPNCVKDFRTWLKNKYGSIERLNHEWWTAFWSHTYSSFEQIEPPGPLTDTVLHGRNLDWRRFLSDSTIDFMCDEIKPLKKITPDIPVTTNLMPFFPRIDYKKLAKHVDFISWDNYPFYNGSEKNDILIASEIALYSDLMRSLKHRPFLLMESAPGLVSWHPYNKIKRPGMHEMSSLQVVAHGSDSVQYFQWRKGRGGIEKFHGAVVDHVGSPNTRVFSDVKRLGERLIKLDEIVGTMPTTQTAIFFEWENMWALEDSRAFSNVDKKFMPTIKQIYHPLWKRGINTDIIGIEDDFSRYKLIIMPMTYMINSVLENKIRDFVSAGGTILCTYMTGMVNENDLCYLGGFPCGQLKEVFGIWNEEIDTLYPDEENIVIMNGETYKAVDYCEIIHAKGANVRAVYDSDFYKGMPAYTVNNYGKGKAYYVAFRDDGKFTDKIIEELLGVCGITSDFDGVLPYGVTAHGRTDGENRYVFVENYSHNAVTIETPSQWINVENGEIYSKNIKLDAVSTVVLKKVLNRFGV